MPVNRDAYEKLSSALRNQLVTLVAVSKTKPVSDILELYQLGQKDFGENYVQELLEKQKQLPKDIRWHFIGHLQSNKVKLLAPFVYLVHGIDSLKVLKEVNQQAKKYQRKIDVLLQVHIAQEETKFGFDQVEVEDILQKYRDGTFPNVRIRGLMGMASFTDNISQVTKEFSALKTLFDSVSTGKEDFDILSMGMSGDYEPAIKEGSNMVRIGSLIFGVRT